MVIAVLMIVTVDLLLLMASGQMLGYPMHPVRLLLGVLLSGLFACFGMLSESVIFRHILGRVVVLVMTAGLVYGFRKQTLGGILLFLLLHFSLGGITGSGKNLSSTLLGAAGIALACILVKNRSQLVQVELACGRKNLRFSALRDTGNSLRDPITGEPVLVVSRTVAMELTGLSPEALEDPVNHLPCLPGLRLIPYESVGNRGFMLGMRINDARIGNRQGSVVVAFSPKNLGRSYQGLTGGWIR